MMQIAFFGHDAADAAIRRRARAFAEDGFSVSGYMMRRGEDQAREWDNVDLGQSHDGAFLQRIRQIFRGAKIAASDRAKLASADLIYARNLDMLACAFLAKRHAKLQTPVIYESLDVHRLLCRKDIIGMMLRALEGALLQRSRALIVSSPGFLRNHFERYYPGKYKAFLVENRLAGGVSYGEREPAGKPPAEGRLRLGWVGNLRCKRSLDLLCKAADELGESVEIHLHGVPARTEVPVFEPLIEARPNMHYHGRYRSPEDLEKIYAGLDVVWAGDFMEAGYNSVWLLPNRIYEGGYFCTPSIAPAGTETAAWIEKYQCGFILGEPLEATLPEFLKQLSVQQDELRLKAGVLAQMPVDVFVQPKGFLREIIASCLEEDGHA